MSLSISKLFLSVVACVVASAGLSASEPTRETVDLRVIKSFAATDGNARFQAYLVDWEGREVVVTDPRANTKFRSDDTITVLVMRLPARNGASPGNLSFLMSPAKYRGNLPSVKPSELPPGKSAHAEMKVSRVVQAEERGHVFRAYVSEWNGQEVIVSDPLGQTNHAVGDTIAVTRTEIPYPLQLESHDIMGFMAVPPRLARTSR